MSLLRYDSFALTLTTVGSQAQESVIAGKDNAHCAVKRVVKNTDTNFFIYLFYSKIVNLPIKKIEDCFLLYRILKIIETWLIAIYGYIMVKMIGIKEK